jgi:translation initiation factor 2 subunit 3
VGVKDDSSNPRTQKIQKLKKGETLMFNVGSTSTGGRVSHTKNDMARIDFRGSKPVCADVGQRIAISRRIEKHWRLIGWGEVIKGYDPLEIVSN